MSEPVVEVVDSFSKCKRDAVNVVGVVQIENVLKSWYILASIYRILRVYLKLKIYYGLEDIGLMKPRSFVSKSDTTHIFTRKQFRIGSLSKEIEPGYVVKKKQSGER